MFAGGSIQLARVAGIRIGVDVSWFLVLFFFVFLLSGSFRAALDSSDTVAYATAVASAMLFFVSLIAHELGHALVARRLGIGITGIDLWFFGGLAKMERDADSPGTEFKIAVAGPLVTLAVVVGCVGLGLGLAGGEGFWAAATLSAESQVSPLLLLLSWLATINTALLVFNLVPAFPLDGGRIARALAWRISGDRLRATRLAAGLGRGFSWVLVGIGVFALVRGDLTGGLWMIVLGWFLGQAARTAVMQTAFSERLEGVRVADIMDAEPVSIPSTLPLARAREEFFLRYGWPWFPVVDPSGRYVGLLREEALGSGDDGAGDERPVAELVEAGTATARVGQDATLESLLASEPLRRVGALMAVDAEGVLRGVVTLAQVRRALQASASHPA